MLKNNLPIWFFTTADLTCNSVIFLTFSATDIRARTFVYFTLEGALTFTALGMDLDGNRQNTYIICSQGNCLLRNIYNSITP